MAINPQADREEDEVDSFPLPSYEGDDPYVKEVWEQAVKELVEEGFGEPGDDDTEEVEEVSQHAEKSSGDEILEKFLAAPTSGKIQDTILRINALKEAHPETSLARIAELVRFELETLTASLATDLATSSIAHEAAGVAELLDSAPIVADSVPPAPPPTMPLAPGGAAEPSVTLPALDDAIRVLDGSPAKVGPNYLATADLVREGAFAVTSEHIEQKAVETLQEELSEALAEGYSRDHFIDNVVAKLGEGTLSEPHLETIFRTNALAAKSNGKLRAMSNPLVASAFPYVSYSATHDARTRPQHLALERLGLNGTNFYRADDPVFLEFRPPWSYNCLMPETIIEGQVELATKANYSGKAIEITTRGGKRLRMTVNHPVLTPTGYCRAENLKIGQQVICYRGGEDVRQFSGRLSTRSIQTGLLQGSHNKNYAPTPIQEIFESIRSFGFISRVKPGIDDFNGDSVSLQGYVDIVSTDRELLLTIRESFQNRRSNTTLPSMYMSLPKESSLRSNRQTVLSPSGASNCLPSLSGLSFNSLPSQTLDFLPLKQFRLGTGADLDALTLQNFLNNVTTDPEFNSQFSNRDSSLIAFEDIVDIRIFEYVGHVYDLQTSEGFMVANSIIVSNCRCNWVGRTVEQAARAGVREAQDWLQRAQHEAEANGGSFYQYLDVTAPSEVEYVAHPPFSVDPEFERIAV